MIKPSLKARYRFVAALLVPVHFFTALPFVGGQQPAQPATNVRHADAFMEKWVPPVPVLSTEPAGIQQAPDVQGPDFSRVALSEIPTIEEVAKARAFETSLNVRPDLQVSEQERGNLGRMAEAYANGGGRFAYGNRAHFDTHLDANPNSPLKANLRFEQSKLFKVHGHLLRQEAALRLAWNECKDRVDEAGKVLADEVMVDLLDLLSTMGRKELLRELLASVKDRKIGGLATEARWRAKHALAFFDTRAERNVFCGFTAANRICVPKGFRPIFPDVHDEVEQKEFIKNGLSLFELRAHSIEGGGTLTPYKRVNGSAIPVPSVIHLSYGHYSAITEEKDGLYRLEDVHLKVDSWVPAEVINEQASGYFVMTAGSPLPEGFTAVGEAESKTIFGRHCTHLRDDQGCNPETGCPKKQPEAQGGSGAAMAFHDLTLLNPGLVLKDTPVSYSTPFGPQTFIQLRYDQRSTVIQDEPSYTHFGARWSHNYLRYIKLTGTGTPNSKVQLINGSGEYYEYNYSSGYSSRFGDLPVIQWVANTGFRATYSDGSAAEYYQGNGTTPDKYFLSRWIDPQGNSSTLRYDSNMRLVAVVDALDQATVLSYTPVAGDLRAKDTYRVRKITDPFGRSASFLYHSNGRLWKIADCMGIVSEFQYKDGDFVEKLTTPYGSTLFAWDEIPGIGIPGRYIEAIDSYGDKERVEQNEYADFPANGVDPYPPTVVSGDVTVTVAGQAVTFKPKLDNLHWRNTYHWDKKAWSMGPGDYSKATTYNWLALPDDKITGVLGSIKKPLEGRVWFNYYGQVSDHAPGTISTPAKVLRRVENPISGQPDVWTIAQTKYTLSDGTTPHPYGMPTGSVDQEGRQTRVLYDEVVNSPGKWMDVLKVQVLDGGAWKDLSVISNYSKHLPGTITDASGVTTTVAYNSRGQVKSATVTKGANTESVKLTYDVNLDGQPDENGYLIKIEATSPTQPEQFVTLAEFAYDGIRRVRTVKDESGYVLTYDYDNFDRVTLVTHPDTTTEQTVYENLHVAAAKERGGLWNRYKFNSLIQLVSQQDPHGRLTQYTWCKCGALSSLTDAMKKVTRWKRDEQGRVEYKLLPDGTTKTSYAYQLFSGRLASVTEPNDQAFGNPTAAYRYALAGQTINVNYTDANTPDVTLSYTDDLGVLDPLGRLRSMVDGIGTTKYEYRPIDGTTSGAGIIWKVNGPWADDTLRYGYDWKGRRTLHEMVTDGNVVTRTESVALDALSRVSQVMNNLGTFTHGYSPGNLSNRVDLVTAPGNLVTALSYFPGNTTGARAYALQGITHTREGTAISAFSYDYDASGRINTWSQQIGTSPANVNSFEYNRSSELIEAVRRNSMGVMQSTNSYRYDAAGNRYLSSDGTAAEHRQHNVLNQITQRGGGGTTMVEGTVDEKSTVLVNSQAAEVKSMPGTSQWKYEHPVATTVGTNTVAIQATDASGNVRNSSYQFTVGAVQSLPTYDLNGNMTWDGARTFEWDSANRLRAVVQGLNRTEFSYDGRNRRRIHVEKLNGIVTSSTRLIWDSTQIIEERNVDGTQVNKRYFKVGMQIVSGTAAGNYFYTRDHLGSIREMIDSAGSVRARYDYDPYGNLSKLSGDLDSDFTFTGHYHHSPTGLFLALYRAYSPQLGIWLNRDPIGEVGGSNLFGYVSGNPLQHIDPLGLAREWSYNGSILVIKGVLWGEDVYMFPPDYAKKELAKHGIFPESWPWKQGPSAATDSNCWDDFITDIFRNIFEDLHYIIEPGEDHDPEEGDGTDDSGYRPKTREKREDNMGGEDDDFLKGKGPKRGTPEYEQMRREREKDKSREGRGGKDNPD